MVRCIISTASSTARLLLKIDRFCKPRPSRNWTSIAHPLQEKRWSTFRRGRGLAADITSQSHVMSGEEVGEPAILDSLVGATGATADAINGEDEAAKALSPEDWEQFMNASIDDLDLPLSPLMDNDVIEAKNQWHAPKARPSKAPTDFQIQLAKSPYAQMLATPVRQCQGTRARLPSYFMQAFTIMAHPETKQPWRVPLDLTKKHQPAQETSEASDAKAPNLVPTSNQFHTKPEALSGSSADQYPVVPGETAECSPIAKVSSSMKSIPKPLPVGAIGYVNSRQKLMEALVNSSSGYGERWKSSYAEIMGKYHSTRRIIQATQWRSDMDTHILELHRRRLVEHLQYTTQLRRGYISRSATWEDSTLAKRQAGGIIWTGPRSGGFANFDDDNATDQIVVPEFSTLEIGKTGKQVPVFNLRRMLGKEHLSKLRLACPSFGGEIMIIKDKRMTVDLRKRLWKLEGYIASYYEHIPDHVAAALNDL